MSWLVLCFRLYQHIGCSLLYDSLGVCQCVATPKQTQRTTCRELTRNSQLVRNQKNRENTRQGKTITRTRQYLYGSAICLRIQQPSQVKKKKKKKKSWQKICHKLSFIILKENNVYFLDSKLSFYDKNCGNCTDMKQ